MFWTSFASSLKNGMPSALKYSGITMCTDNTSLAYSAKNVIKVSEVMNYDLENLRKRRYIIKLSLSVAKQHPC